MPSPKILLILPVYNEEKILSLAVQTLKNAILPYQNEITILIADNNSTDQTSIIGKKLEAELFPLVKYFFISQKGRGIALKKCGQKYPNYSCYIYLDIDLPIPLEKLPCLWQPILQNEKDLFIIKRKIKKRKISRKILSRFMFLFSYILLKINYHDPQSGVKAFSPEGRKILLTCQENGYFLDTEFIVRAKQAGLKIEEIPLPWIEQRFSSRQSKVKIIKDSLDALKALFRIRKNISL